MRNASRMARYMMMRAAHDGNHYDGKREGEHNRDYAAEDRFRDRRGREHYDNGQFAPRNYAGEYVVGAVPDARRYDTDRRLRGGDGEHDRDRRWGGTEHDGTSRMNVIGFDRPYEVPNDYPLRVDYRSGDETKHYGGMRAAGGASGVGMVFTDDVAKEWTAGLRNEDGSRGEHWNMEQVKKLMSQRGIEYNAAEIYAVMNALYSDYCKVFKKYGFNSPEAYLDLALAWLNDADAVDNKAMVYYDCIVKH